MRLTSELFKQFGNFNNQNLLKQDLSKDSKNLLEQETLKGFLLNNNIKKEREEISLDSFNKLSDELLVVENNQKPTETKIEDSFDMKKVLKPVVITSLITIIGIIGISKSLKSYSKIMLNKANLIQPEDLARNMNIVEEPEFALFRALREPNKNNILGLGGVLLMSGFVAGIKNFIDGYKEVWLKKQESDINHNLQKNLITVEAQAFSGKLNTINEMLKEKSKYFKEIFSLNSNKTQNFKGRESEENKEKNNKKPKNIIFGILGLASVVGLSYLIFKDYQKTINNLSGYEEKLKEKLIQSDKIEIFNLNDKNEALRRLKDVLLSTKADDKTIISDVNKIKGITPKEAEEFINDLKNMQIFANADKAIYGTSGKIQYYCYINENRGHLYNWILNPENKFNKYLFLCFTTLSSISYIAKNMADAFKKVVVLKENSKTELNLRKRLVNVEIENFKAKKISAINPLMNDFKEKLNKGYSNEELIPLAQKILLEIKNGPPYVYA